MPRASDIPQLVYDNLRSITEYRFRRALEPQINLEFSMPILSNSQIFLMMPDHSDICWEEIAQPAIIAITIKRMIEYVKTNSETI